MKTTKVLKCICFPRAVSPTPDECLDFIDRFFRTFTEGIVPEVRYFRVASSTIRMEFYSNELLGVVEKQLSCTMCPPSKSWDYTFCIWPGELKVLAIKMPSKEIYKGNSQIIRLFNKNTRLYANDSRRKIFHIAANTFSDDAVADIAQVHIFVRAIALAVKSKNTSLVHAAAVGLNGKGALICGRGGQGKSTLSISALLDGFQYVSDDYLILKKTRELCAYPIYSIATLTPEMQVRMDGLNAEFLAKNPGNSKNIFDISAHSASFVDRLPIAVAVFPELQGNDPPGIEKIDIGQPLTQVVISSMRQVGEWNNPEWTKLLISLLRELTAYKIRLSNDLRENVSFLREILGNRT